MPFSRIQTFLVRCCRVVVLVVAVNSVAYAAEEIPAQPDILQSFGRFFSGKTHSDDTSATASPPTASAAQDTRNLSVSPSGKRVALVIGNAAYPGPAALRNPANDATDMAAKLRKLGFDVILKTDIPLRQMLRTLTEFGDKVTDGAEVLFFYAGHGMQVRGRNYLIPVDAQIGNESSISSEAVDVDQLLDKLSRARLSMVILDACRNNPFERRFRGGGQGLAQINAPTGTLIAYATAPGKVAVDGDGRNGLYTSELLKAMDIPGIKVEDVFKRVRANVVEKSGDVQTPWESSSLTGDFYFIFQGATTVTVQQAPADPEDALWAEVKASGAQEYYAAYLNQYPKGKYAALAKVELKKIDERAKMERKAAAEREKQAASLRLMEEQQHRAEAERQRLAVERKRLEVEKAAKENPPGKVFQNCAKCPDLPIDLAVKVIKKGNGQRVLATFEDPDCSYCKKLESELKSITDVTIYTFIYPILPNSGEISKAIWCAPDRAGAWSEYMLNGTHPAASKCDTTGLERSTALGQNLNVLGTPTIFLFNGCRIPGYAPAAVLEKALTSGC